MKKLITMIASVAMAFGLYAEGGFISGTTFNDLSGTFDGTGDKATWSGFATDNQNKISTTASGAANTARPDYWATAAEATAENLAVKTALDAPIYCAMGEGAGIGTYFDALVKFTAFDVEDAATLPNDGKIGVWMKETATGTNLFVTAGVKTADGVTPTNFDCGDFTAKGADWFRLTVKTMNVGNNNIGFVIFVDGVAVTCNAAKTSFGSIELTTQAQIWNKTGALFLAAVSGAFSQVGFAGTGWVDDIVFTQAEPKKDNVAFAADKAAYTIAWDVDNMADVVIAGVTLSDAEKAAGFAVVEGAAPDSLTISWTGKNGKASGSNVAMTKNGNAFTAPTLVDAEAEFGGKPLTLTDAVAAANAAETAGTLKLLDDVKDDITFEVAGTTLDLNGWTLTGRVSGKIILDNTADKVAIITGLYEATGSIEKTNIKFGYAANEDELNPGTCAIVEPTLPAGKVFAQGKDDDAGYWVLVDKPYFQINDDGEKCATLAAAIEAAKAGDTINLLENRTLTADDNAWFTKNLTLDLGGFKLTLPSTAQGANKGGVAAGVANTITNGTVELKESSLGYRVVGTLVTDANWEKTNGAGKHYPLFDVVGEVTVNGGTLENETGDIFRSKADPEQGENGPISVTVNGATITANDIFYMYRSNLTYNVTITAGTLTGTKAIFNEGVVDTMKGVKCSLTDECKARFSETNSVAPQFVAPDYELVKEQDSDFYVIQAKQSTDPIPPVDPKAEPSVVSNAIDNVDYADKAAIQAAINGDPAKYAAFKDWADKTIQNETAVIASEHAADSFLLGQEALLKDAPVAEIETIAKDGDTVTLTFEIKDGQNAITVAQTAAEYVKTLVQCAEDVGFANKLDANVTVTISETTLTATVALPTGKTAAFMKIAK